MSSGDETGGASATEAMRARGVIGGAPASTMLDANRLVPTLSADPFATEHLLDPYPLHRAIRDAAAVVWLERYGIWAMARHAEVHAALTDWSSYSSAAGVGLADFRRDKPWRPPSLLLEADPPEHTRARGVVTAVLSRATLNGLREGFRARALELVAAALSKGEIDAIADLAKAFPLAVFPDAVGLPVQGRENLLPYGNMAFNAFGPRNALLEESMRDAAPVTAWIMAQCRREALAPGGLGTRIFAAADAGQVTEHEAGLLVRSLLTAGVDTTVHGIGNALVCLARNPQAWSLLHAQPTLARQAFEEALRLESPVQTFFRTTARPTRVGDATLAEGTKVLLFLGAANRDPRRWPEPERYDVMRSTSGHVAFGTGIHGCLGQMLARLEAEVLIEALAARVAHIEPLGEPVPLLNNTLRGWGRFAVRLHPA